MTVYDNRLLSSDLDAFRSDGTEQLLDITFSGNISGGGTQTQTTSWYDLTDMDFSQVLYENSRRGAGEWRELAKEDVTNVLETTGSTYLSAGLYAEVDSANERIRFHGIVFNAYAGVRALQSTTITFRFVAYDSTLL